MSWNPEEMSSRPLGTEQSFVPLLVSLCFAATLFPLSAYIPYLFTVIASVALLSGIMAVLKAPVFRACVGAALCLCLPMRWLTHFCGDQYPWITFASHALLVVYFALLEAYVISKVLTHARITHQTVLGAICGYLLIGVIFTFAFACLTHLYPNAIQVNGAPVGQENPTDAEAHVAELIYFSFMTLSTVGYGDIIPVSPTARSMVIVEALSGQIYLAAFVARLVGLMSVATAEKVPPD